MYEQMKILDLLNQKKIKQYELKNIIYGSIEIRETDNKKIYIHSSKRGWTSIY